MRRQGRSARFSISRSWRVTVCLPAAAAMLSVIGPSAEAAVSRYASPSGTGSACTQATPCSLTTALDGAAPGDDVFIIAGQGDYRLDSGIEITRDLRLHGQNGRPRLVFADGGLRLRAGSADGLFVQGNSTRTSFALDTSAATGDRIVATNIANGNACYLHGARLTNSVCWAAASTKNAVETDGSNTLRNVTAIGTGGPAIKSYGRDVCGCSSATNTLVNVIARTGPGKADLELSSDGSASVTLDITHTNYGTTATSGDGAPGQTRVNADGTNQNTQPLFVDAANGNFQQASGSPTVDAGVTDGANGAADVDGDPRAAGKATDIGADELVPAAPAVVGVSLTRQTVNVRNGRAPIRVACPAVSQSACSGTLTLSGRLSGRATVLGRKTFAIAPGKTASVAVPLSRSTLGFLKPGRTLKATATATTRGGAGTARTVTAAILLKPPR